eukprot:scaffold1946_cov116-Skeletonema_marinoi.AAC.9
MKTPKLSNFFLLQKFRTSSVVGWSSPKRRKAPQIFLLTRLHAKNLPKKDADSRHQWLQHALRTPDQSSYKTCTENTGSKNTLLHCE